MSDIAHRETEQLIHDLERRLTTEYSQATQEVKDKLDDYLRRFQTKDEAWQRMVANGEKTPEDYAAWRQSQIMVGENWENLKDTLASDLHQANVNARALIIGEMPTAYAANFNYATYQVERAGRVDTGFTLYNREAVERLAKDEPDLLKPPGARRQQEFKDFDAYRNGQQVDITPKQEKAFNKLIAEGKDIRWQRGQIQSVTMQSILQGESIPNMARRIARTMGETDRRYSVMYARTAMTSAQNAGRQDAYKRAEDLGVKLQREWVATLDDRTRHEHRLLDGQIRAVDEPFEADGEEIMYPGDPAADPAMIFNCRCTTVAVVDGWESKSGALRSDEDLGGMSYEEWKEGHSKPENILNQQEIGEAIREQTIRELYGGEGTSEQTPVPIARNSSGDEIQFSEKMQGEKWDRSKDIITELSNEFETKLQIVKPGSEKSAGSVQISGTVMNLSSTLPDIAIHEFAHTISMENQTKFGLADESSFWKEIKKVQREYKRETADDPRKWISSYEHSSKGSDEFLAEAFTLARMREKGMDIPKHYGNDTEYSGRVYEIVKKYFGK